MSGKVEARESPAASEKRLKKLGEDLRLPRDVLEALDKARELERAGRSETQDVRRAMGHNYF